MTKLVDPQNGPCGHRDRRTTCCCPFLALVKSKQSKKARQFFGTCPSFPCCGDMKLWQPPRPSVSCVKHLCHTFTFSSFSCFKFCHLFCCRTHGRGAVLRRLDFVQSDLWSDARRPRDCSRPIIVHLDIHHRLAHRSRKWVVRVLFQFPFPEVAILAWTECSLALLKHGSLFKN